MKLIDTHGHLNLAPLLNDWEVVWDRCRAHGVSAVVVPGTDFATSEQGIALARARPGQLWAGVGLHPTHISDQRIASSKWEEFERLARQPAVVAIGEVGLDTYRIKMTNDELRMTNALEKIIDHQEFVLRKFIGLAQTVQKPLILHCRGNKHPVIRPPSRSLDRGTAIVESGISDLRSPNQDPHDRLIGLLSSLPDAQRPKFVIHCYQGSADQINQYLDLGGFISFTGSITYTDDRSVTEVIQAVPLDRLMIETDSPFLSPVPYRGQTNEPWKVVEIARRIADLKDRSLDEVAATTTQNAINFFNLSLGD